jgi:hypothetical protein
MAYLCAAGSGSAVAPKTGRLNKNGSLPSTGDALDLQNRTDIAVDSRSIQLFTFIARTLEISVLWTDQMATLFADRPSIEMGHHGPELKAENAIGAADCRLDHRSSRMAARVERQRSVGNLVNVCSHRRIGNNLYPDKADSKWPSGAVHWHGSATRQNRRIGAR